MRDDHREMAVTIPTDEQGHSAFRTAVEAKDFDRLAETLAADVEFRSPAVFAPILGRDAVGGLLRVVGAVIGPDLAYQWQTREGDREVLCFRTRAGDREIEGVDLIRYGSDGLVAELVVMVRPASGLAALREAIAARRSGP